MEMAPPFVLRREEKEWQLVMVEEVSSIKEVQA